MSSAVYVAIAVFVILLVIFAYRKKKIMNRVKNHEDDDYKTPLSDDIQKIYYEKYEKEMMKSDEADKEESSDKEEHPVE